MADLKDILSEENDQPKDDELINYIADNLSEEEKYELEKKIVDSSFVNDAVEGLQKFDQKESLNQYVQQLNKNLHQQLAIKKQRKEKRRLKENPWLVITIIILLAICLISYYIINLHKRNRVNTPVTTEAKAGTPQSKVDSIGSVTAKQKPLNEHGK